MANKLLLSVLIFNLFPNLHTSNSLAVCEKLFDLSITVFVCPSQPVYKSECFLGPIRLGTLQSNLAIYRIAADIASEGLARKNKVNVLKGTQKFLNSVSRACFFDPTLNKSYPAIPI